MTRVGLNLAYLLPGETGGRETYARELIPALLEQAGGLEFVAFVNRDAGKQLVAELGEGIEAIVLPIRAASRAQWALAELALVSLAARRARVQLVHSLANFGPAWGRFRHVLTIHDLQYKLLPQLLSWPMRTGTALLTSLAARHADRIIAVSAAARSDVVTELGVDRERIDVVHNGLRPLPPSAPGTDAQATVRAQLAIGQRPVVLCVASNLPHKNLAALIDALALIGPPRPVAVFVGHATDDGELVGRARAARVNEDVRALGTRAQQELETLYALADCLVLPTLFEGFGLPVLESMARSLPVLCSDLPPLREVAGDAASYFDPRAPTEIATSIQRLLADPGEAARMRDRGRSRAAAFSWRAAAEGTLASYRRAMEEPSPRQMFARAPA